MSRPTITVAAGDRGFGERSLRPAIRNCDLDIDLEAELAMNADRPVLHLPTHV